MSEEIWKDIDWIKGLEGQYQVSNLGRVKSLGNQFARKEKILKTCITGGVGNQYLAVLLSKGYVHRKSCLVHKLVAAAFCPNPGNTDSVYHEDGDNLNNHYTNLVWKTKSEIVRDGYVDGTLKRRVPTSLTREQAGEIRRSYHGKQLRLVDLAVEYNVSTTTIHNIVSYKRHK